MRTTFFALAATAFAGSAYAEPPRVVADVAPIHSLVAQVMDGVGVPTLLMQARTSPHGHALKVSQARALAEADLVFWVGESLTPWLEKALDTLTHDAVSVELVDTENLSLLEYSEDEDAHHDHEDDDDHQGVDPHIWLDPVNAQVLVSAIAQALASHDPENAEQYRSNARAASKKLDALIAETTEATATIKDRRYIVYHDGYRYFEARFGLGRAIPISDGHATTPGAKRLSAIRDAVSEFNVSCVFSEKQFGSKTVRSIVRGTDTIEAELDPMGQSAEIGPALYGALIRDLTKTMVGCLKPS
jgi:zinc transport system substrate-binding protein